MSQSLKELIVILVITAPLWHFSKRLFAPLSEPGDFERRRNVWIFLTVVGVLSPSIWIYALLGFPVMYWAGRRDSNPVALYLLLFYVVPNASVYLPSIIVDNLFAINNQRLLAFSVILPAIIFARRSISQKGSVKGWRSRKLDVMDWLLIGYLLLTVALPIPYESLTNTLRRTFLTVLDVGVLFAIFSRLRPQFKTFHDCLGAWVLAAMMMSIVAIFESARGWLLYASISSQWGDQNSFAYLMRDGTLRAQATAGHSLTLGIWLTIAWAFYLFIQSGWKSKILRVGVGLLLLGGLMASMARGAWIAALFATVVYLLMNPKGVAGSIRGIGALLLILGGVLISPLGDKVIDLLPFIGTVDSGNVEYRQQLFDVSIDLISVNPWFGSPFVLDQMESLRQGQGIIDLVNGYLTVALYKGLVGLTLFLGFLSVGVFRARSEWSLVRGQIPEQGRLGAAMIAAMLGTMLFIATAGVDPMTYMLAGFLSSYWWMRLCSRRASSERARTAGAIH